MCLKGSDDTQVAISFNRRSKDVQLETDARSEAQSRPVFIPTKEVLSLVRAMQDENHDRSTVEMIFDDTYLDLAALLTTPSFEDEAASLEEDPRLSNIVRELVSLVGGRYRWTNGGGFQFEPGNMRKGPIRTARAPRPRKCIRTPRSSASSPKAGSRCQAA